MSDASAADDAKPEERKGLLDKLGAVLPIGLTAIAAVFGSMSAGELQQAMYWKSQAAQDQSKSTNQWTLAGFKRDRALIMEGDSKTLRALCEYEAANFSLSALPPLRLKKDDPTPDESRKKMEAARAQALSWLVKKDGPPPVSTPEITDEGIKELRKALEERGPRRNSSGAPGTSIRARSTRRSTTPKSGPPRSTGSGTRRSRRRPSSPRTSTRRTARARRIGPPGRRSGTSWRSDGIGPSRG